MTAFFIKTDGSSVGPFTGIELREAALSRVITAKSQIGGSAQGPWTLATETGLFSEAKTPLPHPDGVHVPQYHVRGLSFAAKGPFKLRELIGFAARGMLREDGQLQSDVSSEWIAVERIPILAACLTGELVLLSSDGRMRRKAGGEHHGRAKDETQSTVAENSEQETARAPVEVNRDSLRRSRWKQEKAENSGANNSDARAEVATLQSTGSFDQARLDSHETEATAEVLTTEPTESDDESLRWWQRSVHLPKVNLNPTLRLSDWRVSRRVAVSMLVFLALGASIATALTQWRSLQIRPEQIVGTWIAEDHSFGVSFRDDGDCVFYSPSGNSQPRSSWSGQYEWVEYHEQGQQFRPSETVSTTIAAASPGDTLSDVVRSDGYIRFHTTAFQRITIRSQETSDCFLRMQAGTLQIGYLTQVEWSATGKRMEAAWINVLRQPPGGLEPLSDIANMEVEPPPQVGFAVERSPYVSQVARALMLQYETGDSEASQTDGRCYSVSVDADYLLRQYGVPDEARPLLPFDLTNISPSNDFSESTLVRYGPMRMIVSTEGKLQHLSLVQ